MRSISQIIVSILLVGVTIVAGSMLSYIATETMASQKPSEIVIARVGDINVDLFHVSDKSYLFTVTAKLVNFGSQPVEITGSIVMLIKGTTGKALVVRCIIGSRVTINPGEIKEATGLCNLDKQQVIQSLFGTQTPPPPADTIRASMTCLYLYLIAIQSSTSGTTIIVLPS